MSRLPPIEKFSLSTRKNLRDDWEAKKPDFEKQFSDLLGVPWTIDINPNAICAYATDPYSRDQPGTMLSSYMSQGLYQLNNFINKYREQGKHDLNIIASAHVITMDLDEEEKFHYCGCEISPTGQLVIRFCGTQLGTNVDHAINVEHLTKALNNAPESAASVKLPMSFVCRHWVAKEYEGDSIKSVQDKVSKIFKRPITFEPNFQPAYQLLSTAPDVYENWQQNIGIYVKKYYEGLVWWCGVKRFEDDDMLRDAFNEAVHTGIVAFRMLPDGALGKDYNNCVIENGVLFLQTTPKFFGTNTDYVTEKLIDIL